MIFRVDCRVKYDLGDPLPVPEIDEDHTAVIPAPMDPAHQHDFLVYIAGIEFPAMMRSAHVA
jgi:hypothetical protein